jgi:hypothetical protein
LEAGGIYVSVGDSIVYYCFIIILAMKKRILTSVIITFSIIELFAQLPPDKEIKKVGQFEWKWTAEDSLNIMQNPFIEDLPEEKSLPYSPIQYNKDMDGMMHVIPDPPATIHHSVDKDDNRQHSINGDNKK